MKNLSSLLFGIIICLGCEVNTTPTDTSPDKEDTNQNITDSSSSSSSSSSGGMIECIPTTCAEQDKNCGEMDNGCGVSLKCGECDLNKYQYGCGIDYHVDENTQWYIPTPNVCGGGCYRYPSGNNFCDKQTIYTVDWGCISRYGNPAPANPLPPKTDCIPAPTEQTNLAPYVWCCTE